MKTYYQKITYRLLILVMLIMPVVNAQAEDDYSSDSTGLWQGSAEFGLQKTSGNTNTSNINGKLNLVQNLTYWRNTYIIESTYSTSNDVTTSELYRGSLQSDYKYNNKEFLFLRGELENDHFSGYRYKSSVSTGYGNRLWQGADGSYFEASAGVGYSRDQLKDETISTADDAFNIGIFTRFKAQLEKYISDTSTFKQELTTKIDMEYGNNETESTTSLQTDIIENLAMKLSYRVNYDTSVPDNAEHTNTETSLTFLYSF